MLGRVRNLALAIAVVAALLVPSRADAGDGKKVLPLLADTVELVAVLDVADARDAATFDALVTSAPAKLADVLAMLAAVGIDARQDVDTIVMGGHGDVYQLVLEGRFDKDQLGQLATGGTAARHRGVRYLSGGDTEAALLGKRLVITSAGEMTGVIDRHKKKGRSLTRAQGAAPMRKAIALVDQRHDLWFAATSDGLGGGSAEIDAVGVGATFGADLTVEVRIRVADVDRIEQMRRTVEQAMPQLTRELEKMGLSGMAGSLVFEWEGTIVEASATLPTDELTTVLGMLAML